MVACGCDSASDTYCTEGTACTATSSSDDTCCTGTDKICKTTHTCVTSGNWTATACSCTFPNTETYCVVDETCKLTTSTDSAACCTATTHKLCRKTNTCVTVANWNLATCDCDAVDETYCSVGTRCRVTISTNSAACCTADTHKLCRNTNLCVAIGDWTAASCDCEAANETYCAADSTCKLTTSTDSAACCTAVTHKLCRTTNGCVLVANWSNIACGCDSATDTYCTGGTPACVSTSSSDDTCCLGTDMICKNSNSCVI